MREEAARSTPPGVAGTKKKMPQGLTVCLEALVRPFYISADAAPNVNKAKRAMWSLMMPILTPWSAENTIKTKMQKVNTQVLGAYQLEKNKLEGIAQWTGMVLMCCTVTPLCFPGEFRGCQIRCQHGLQC